MPEQDPIQVTVMYELVQEFSETFVSLDVTGFINTWVFDICNDRELAVVTSIEFIDYRF